MKLEETRKFTTYFLRVNCALKPKIVLSSPKKVDLNQKLNKKNCKFSIPNYT